ncbi:MAG: hypothetical protein WAW91_00115 [Candidatus Nanoperiomorbaceae bacterium]
MEIMRFTPMCDMEDSFRRLTNVSDERHPYINAHSISIESVSVDDVRPTQLYIYNPALERQKRLRDSMGSLGIDTLAMTGRYEFSDSNGHHVIIPPVIEMTDDGEKLIVDGTHRTFLARQLGLAVIKVILIDGVDKTAPPFGEPARWDEVRQYDSLEGVQKRRSKFPREDKGKYYRDFSGITGRISGHRDG